MSSIALLPNAVQASNNGKRTVLDIHWLHREIDGLVRKIATGGRSSGGMDESLEPNKQDTGSAAQAHTEKLRAARGFFFGIVISVAIWIVIALFFWL